MTGEELERALDRMFQAHPSEMVKQRNALADQLKKAGDKEGALRVKALSRPTPAAWALNQLWFEQRELLEQARAAAERIRALHAQPALDQATLRAALSAQRAAVAALVAAGELCCARAEVACGPAQQRKLLSTVQGWLAGVGDEAPGRMTKDLEAGGFEGVRVVAASAVQQATAHATSAPAPAPRTKPASREKLDIAQKALAEKERRVRTAKDDVQRRQAEQQACDKVVRELHERVRRAEQALEALRSDALRAQQVLRASDAALEQAREREREAIESVTRARRELEQLEAD